MSDKDIQRGLNLVRYGGIVVTLMVFITLVAYFFAIDPTGGQLLGQTWLYILGFTILAAILSVALYFGYRAYLMGKKA